MEIEQGVRNALLGIAVHAEEHGSITDGQCSAATAAAVFAGCDWPVRWGPAVDAVIRREPGAKESFMKLADTCEGRVIHAVENHDHMAVPLFDQLLKAVAVPRSKRKRVRNGAV